jgi:hypothetical protein
MSHSYGTSTYMAPAGDVPGRLDSPDQLRALASAAFLEQEKSPDRLIYVSGATRGGWGIYIVKALVEALDLPSLGFLADRGQHKFETEDGFTAVTVLGPPVWPAWHRISGACSNSSGRSQCVRWTQTKTAACLALRTSLTRFRETTSRRGRLTTETCELTV